MRFGYLAFGTLLGCLLLLVAWPTAEVQAHFCDDNYADQKDRENCWWRYWNGFTDTDQGAQATASSTISSSESAVDGTLCDRLFVDQQDRENCWWRYWNGWPLIPTNSISQALAIPEPGTTSGNPATATNEGRSPTTNEGRSPTQVGQDEDEDEEFLPKQVQLPNGLTCKVIPVVEEIDDETGFRFTIARLLCL